ncbi:MAG TPA: response regulator [Ktedonobacteraceae bacterium]|nr:response regulator [Ktedonobacteraceae bacterium]
MKEHVWVIDDQQDILDVVQIVLDDAGYQTSTYLTGASLLQPMEHPPDLILLDILLSGEDGRVICRQLKSREQTRQIPVVLLSAHFNAAKAIEECGADDFLAKPFHLDELVNTVKKNLPDDTPEK